METTDKGDPNHEVPSTPGARKLLTVAQAFELQTTLSWSSTQK